MIKTIRTCDLCGREFDDAQAPRFALPVTPLFLCECKEHDLCPECAKSLSYWVEAFHALHRHPVEKDPKKTYLSGLINDLFGYLIALGDCPVYTADGAYGDEHSDKLDRVPVPRAFSEDGKSMVVVYTVPTIEDRKEAQMAENTAAQKSHAEIIAECYHNTASTRYVRNLLDRLEAAHERELAAKDAEIAKLRHEIDLCRGTGAASKARDLIEEMHRIHRLCSETDGDNWKQKIREISCKASWY